jgi:hypothetical protein
LTDSGERFFSFNVGSNLSWRSLTPTCPKFSKTSDARSKYEIGESEYLSPVLPNIKEIILLLICSGTLRFLAHMEKGCQRVPYLCTKYLKENA